MTTFQQAIQETRDYLMTGQPDRVNVLDGAIDDSPATTTLTLVHDPKAIAEGTQLSIGLEDMHVVARSGNSVTVIRGLNGTITSHADGDIVRVNPQFSDRRIGIAINRCLESISADGLFWVDDVTFTYTPAQMGYNLTLPGFLSIWRVRYNQPGPAEDWPVLMPQDYDIDVHPDETAFPGGAQFVLRQGGYPGQLVRVSYRREFDTLTDLADTLEDTAHLPSTAHEIPPLGAAFRLLSGRDIKRSFLDRQPEPRRAEEVPPGAATQSMAPIVQAYYDAIDREALRLISKYPRQL